MHSDLPAWNVWDDVNMEAQHTWFADAGARAPAPAGRAELVTGMPSAGSCCGTPGKDVSISAVSSFDGKWVTALVLL